MVRHCEQCCVRHRVDGVSSSQVAHIERVRCCSILDAGGGEQQFLGGSPGGDQVRHASRGPQRHRSGIGRCPHRDTDRVAHVRRKHVIERHIPAADEERGHRRHLEPKACLPSALEAPEVCFSRGEVLLGREQEGHVHRHPVEHCLLDRHEPSRSARNLDEQIGPIGLGMKLPSGGNCRLGIVSQCGGDL